MNQQETQKPPKTNKWRVVVTILVLAILTFGGYNTGYDAGYDVGHDTGYDKGYKAGYEEGKNDLYQKFLDEYEHLGAYDWMLEHIVFTTRTGECYHTAYCQYTKNREIWVHFVENASRDGYRPCSVCIEQ